VNTSKYFIFRNKFLWACLLQFINFAVIHP
jgi:hypothetical protein